MQNYRVQVSYTVVAETTIKADHFETAEDMAIEMLPPEFKQNVEYLNNTLEILEVEEI